MRVPYVFEFINIVLALGVLAWPLFFIAGMFLLTARNAPDVPVLIMLLYLAYPIPVIFGNMLFWKNRSTSSFTEHFMYTLLGASGYLVIILIVVGFLVLMDLRSK